jgi:hypothetical protein
MIPIVISKGFQPMLCMHLAATSQDLDRNGQWSQPLLQLRLAAQVLQ